MKDLTVKCEKCHRYDETVDLRHLGNGSVIGYLCAPCMRALGVVLMKAFGELKVQAKIQDWLT